MALSLDAFVVASKPRRMACGVERLLASLKADDRRVVEAAMADPTVTHASIERVLKENGHELRAATVRRHRSGGCGCGS